MVIGSKIWLASWDWCSRTHRALSTDMCLFNFFGGIFPVYCVISCCLGDSRTNLTCLSVHISHNVHLHSQNVLLSTWQILYILQSVCSSSSSERRKSRAKGMSVIIRYNSVNRMWEKRLMRFSERCRKIHQRSRPNQITVWHLEKTVLSLPLSLLCCKGHGVNEHDSVSDTCLNHKQDDLSLSPECITAFVLLLNKAASKTISLSPTKHLQMDDLESLTPAPRDTHE